VKGIITAAWFLPSFLAAEHIRLYSLTAALRAEKGAVAKTGPGVGKAAIGGPFKLLNQDGKVVTDRDFLGNWSLIYFGFTYCPDICPDELTKLAEAIDKIGQSSHCALCSFILYSSIIL